MKAKPRAYWPVALAVVLVAFFFRFYRLADHPLGIFFDPAINGLDVVRLLERGGPVIFFPTNGGREALFMYLLIPFVWLFGTVPFSLRALPAAISLLNVALLFGFLYDTRYLLEPLKLSRDRLWLAGLAGLALAVSYWHFSVSRLGQRPIMVPALAVAIFWSFLKGWNTGRTRWFLLSGLLLGLAGHTYSAARLLPLILGLALLPDFFRLARRPDWTRLKPLLLNLAIFSVAALAVYLPMAWYLLTHPAQFTARAGSVMVWNFLDTPAAIVTELGRNLLRVLAFFCCVGTPNPIFGLPGYPGLALLLTPLLVIGLIGAFAHSRELFHRLLLIWWLVGLAPSLVAIEAPHPWRMIVAVVPTAALVGLAPFYLAAARPRLFHSGWLRWLALGLVLASVPGALRAYFVDWTALQVTRGVYDYGAIAIRDEVLKHAADGRPFYLPLSRFNDSTLLYYLSGRFQRQAALSTPADSRGALVISPDKNVEDTTWVRLQGRTATVLPPLTAEGQQPIHAALAAPDAAPIRAADGEVAARLAVLPVDPVRFVQQPDEQLSAAFGPAQLAGATYDRVIKPEADQLGVTLFWQANAPMRDEYEVLVHLVDDNRQAWGSGDARPTDWVYPTTFWRPGQDRIAARHLVKLEPTPLPPGRYWLAVSLFDPAAGRRLPLTGTDSPSPDTVFLGPLKVPPAAPTLPAGPAPVEVQAIFGDLIKLAGYIPDQLIVPVGEPLQFTLIWQALAAPAADYTVFVHLLDSENNLVAGNDIQPVANQYPTTIWSPGESILDSHSLPTTTVPPGQYRLAIGLYHQPTGVRLPLQLPDDRIDPTGRLILNRPVIIMP